MQNGSDMNNGFKNTKEWSAQDILKMANSGAVNTGSKWYSTAKQANAQFGDKYEKIEMVMQYMTFANEIEETECFRYLIENVK
jgi:hypothetical protein